MTLHLYPSLHCTAAHESMGLTGTKFVLFSRSVVGTQYGGGGRQAAPSGHFINKVTHVSLFLQIDSPH